MNEKSCLSSLEYFFKFFLLFTESAARETLEKVMADALAESRSTRASVQAVCLSASGVDHPKDQHRILTWLRFNF